MAMLNPVDTPATRPISPQHFLKVYNPAAQAEEREETIEAIVSAAIRQYSATDYGVKADGVTDDTTALQAAINAAVAANGILSLPEGEIITGPLTVGAAGSSNTCAIRGVDFDGHYTTTTSRRTVIKLKAGSNGTLFTIPASNASDVGPGPVQFENLWLKGNQANQSGTSHAIDYSSHTASSNKQRSGFHRRVRIEDFKSGGVKGGTLRNAGLMDQVVILNIGSGGTGSALTWGSCADWRFWACDFGSTSGPVVQDSGSAIFTYVQCNFFTGGTHGYKADTAAGTGHFIGCSFDRNNRNGVNIGTTNPYPWTFTNCRFSINSQETDATYFDVSITDNPNVEFVGCHFTKGGGSIVKFPAYHFDLNGVTTKGIGVVGCVFEATAAGAIVADSSNLAMMGVSTYNSFRVIHDPLDVNALRVEGGNTGQSVSVYAAGDDSNIPLDIKSKGTSSVRVYTQNGTLQFVVSNTTGATSYVQVAGSTGDQPSVSAQGSASNIDLTLTPKGTGNVRFGTVTASGDVACNGYVTIKDSAGNAVKLMKTA